MLEHILLIVPPALELVFSFTLAVSSASVEGKKRWVLVLDGLSFFLLALTDFLAHVIPKISSSVHVFSIIDTVLAAVSLLPLLFYTVFLFLFARANLISTLPTRFSRVVIFSLLVIVPFILAANELSSLLGLAHISVPVPNHAPAVEVGFSTPFHQHISLFFSATCLALFTLFQMLIFMITFVRLARGFIEERRIETTSQDPQAREEIHLFRGIGWLAVGLKLGAIETGVGFTNTSFAAVIIRRALRFFARGTLIIGVMKGLNIVEDISSLESALRAHSRPTRRSKYMSRRLSRVMISDPRDSTFQELSPEASSFHAAQLARREKHGKIGPSPLALGGESNMARFNDADFIGSDIKSDFGREGLGTSIVNTSRSSAFTNQRVTVHYDGRTPPVLQLRFSVVDMDVHPLPLPLSNPFDNQSNPSSPGPSHTTSQVLDHDDGLTNIPLQAVPEDLREDQVSLSDPEYEQQLFYGGYVPQTVPIPQNTQIPLRPPRDLRGTSYTSPSFISDVAMPFQNRDRDSLHSSVGSPRTSITLSQYIRSPSQEHHPSTSYETTRSLRRSARTASGASDSLEVVREIAARFPGLPPRVLPAKPHAVDGTQSATEVVHAPPPGLGDDADVDSDAEWRTLARERSLKRRREMEAQQLLGAWDASQGNDGAVGGAVADISPVNSIKRKPAPRVTETHVGEAVSEPVAMRAVVTARAATEHEYLDDPSSIYSSSDDGSNYGEPSNTNRASGLWTPASTAAVTPPGLWTPATTVTAIPGPWTPATTGAATPGPWTPVPSSAVLTPELRTPSSWVRGNEGLVGQPAGRAIAVGQGEDVIASSPQRPQQKPPPLRLQTQTQPQPHQRGPTRENTLENIRLHRLTLLRRELRASAQDTATANSALEPELQAPWLHIDPLTQLQTMGTGMLHVADEEAVLDDAWRRAGLTRITSVNRVRVHTTPRVEHGFDVRGSLMAVEEVEEEGEEVEEMEEVEEVEEEEDLIRLSPTSTQKKLARSDSGVLGEEDRMLIRQGRT